MKFWDSSALVPLVVPETETATVIPLQKKDPEIIVWLGTVTELYSAIYRKIREGTISAADISLIRSRITQLQKGWTEVVQFETVRARAHRLLSVHPLRAADSLQLAAAIIACEDHPEGTEFVTFDSTLAEAARREGFTILPT